MSPFYELTQKQLKDLFQYNEKTGVFIWKKKTHSAVSKISIGDVAGSLWKSGYVAIGINGASYYACRLAWLYVKEIINVCSI